MKRIGVLVSGGGSNLQSIIDAIDKGDICAQISLVISSRQGVYGLERAAKYGIPSLTIEKRDYEDHESFGLGILKHLKENEIDILVLAGYLNILPRNIIDKYKNGIVNVHPSLIPSFCGKGFYGDRVHQAVLDYGMKITGATVHFVDEGTDTGPIILQQPVVVMDEDDAKSLGERVLEVEHQLLPQAIKLLVEDRLVVDGRRVIIKNVE